MTQTHYEKGESETTKLLLEWKLHGKRPRGDPGRDGSLLSKKI